MIRSYLACIGIALWATATGADLQNVEVGGQIDVYSAWYTKFYEPLGVVPHYPIPVPVRPLGFGGLASDVRADGRGNDDAYVEQRTLLHVRADLTQNAAAFLEFRDDTLWGKVLAPETYILGVKGAQSYEDLELFQGYLEAANLFGQPLRLRIGRQAIQLGSGWLVGDYSPPDPFRDLSFDAVRLTYTSDSFSLDGWWSKLIERSPAEQDGDVDFYGLQATCTALKDLQFDLYWLLVRDARSVHDTNRPFLDERLEDALGLDQYEATNLHTIGARSAGTRGRFDWEAEAAYQFGYAGAVGTQFKPVNWAFGDDHASWDNWGGHFSAGYTFDGPLKPRVFIQGQYYGGEDRRHVGIRQWLNPLDRAKASMSFNRLFSMYRIESFLDNSYLTNVWTLGTGVDARLTESLKASLSLQYLQAVAPFAWPASLRFGYTYFPFAPDLFFWDKPGSRDLGWELNLTGSYAYSEALTFQIFWSHFFVGKGVDDGVFSNGNGTALVGGTGDHDVDLLYWQATICF